jgi:hypothetical protein
MLDTNRVRISLGGRLEQMVHWFLTNDPQYMGKRPQDVIEMLLERGVDAVYQEGLANAERLDPALEEELTKLSVDEIGKAVMESRDDQ